MLLRFFNKKNSIVIKLIKIKNPFTHKSCSDTVSCRYSVYKVCWKRNKTEVLVHLVESDAKKKSDMCFRRGPGLAQKVKK